MFGHPLEKKERRRERPALKVVCSGVGTAVGRGGRPTLPINLRRSREDCSQGKYSLHPVTQGRLLILPGRYVRAHRQRMRTVLFTGP